MRDVQIPRDGNGVSRCFTLFSHLAVADLVFWMVFGQAPLRTSSLRSTKHGFPSLSSPPETSRCPRPSGASWRHLGSATPKRPKAQR